MECLKTNCNVTSNDRMISCWLCLGCCHLKCSGLKPRDADALADPSKSLQWSCPRCKVVNVEFYKFFKSYKDEFVRLHNEFSILQDKFSKFGELFTNYPKLDNFVIGQNVSSPKKKKTVDKCTTPTPAVTYSSTTTPLISIEADNITSPLPVTSIANSPSVSSPVIVASQSSITPIEVNESQVGSRNNISPLQGNVQLSANLRTITPRRTIFATRFQSDTTVEEVSNYISSKFSFKLPDNINIYKINARNRASFKIIVPVEYFDQINNANFWPKYTIVREFIYREVKLTNIPVCENTASKN